jgi:exonuclease SbcD
MRILHLADLHLGIEQYGRYDPATGASSRLADFAQVLDVAIDRAIAESVDLFLFAGDAYKTRDPNPTQQRILAQRLRRLLEHGIPVFLLTGNHDMPNAVARATSLDIFGELALSGFIVANRPRLHLVQTRTGPLYVVAVPWLTRSALLSKEEHKSLPPEKLHQVMLERLEQGIDAFLTEMDEETPAVLALHGTLQGATFGSERSAMLSQDLVIPKSVVCRDRFSYLALGHIHKHQVVSRAPLAVYAGSPERIDFGEEHDRKGFVLVSLDRRGASHTFEDLPARPFLTVDVESDRADPTPDTLEALRGRDVAGKIVRVRAHLTPANQDKLRESEIRQALHAASFVVVYRQVGREWRETNRGAQYSTGMTPLEALHTYLTQQPSPYSDEHRTQLLATGTSLIAEVLGHEALE